MAPRFGTLSLALVACCACNGRGRGTPQNRAKRGPKWPKMATNPNDFQVASNQVLHTVSWTGRAIDPFRATKDPQYGRPTTHFAPSWHTLGPHSCCIVSKTKGSLCFGLHSLNCNSKGTFFHPSLWPKHLPRPELCPLAARLGCCGFCPPK